MDSNNPNLLKGQFFIKEFGNVIVPCLKMSLRNNLSFPIKTVRGITASPLALSNATIGLKFALHNAGYDVGGGSVLVEESKL